AEGAGRPHQRARAAAAGPAGAHGGRHRRGRSVRALQRPRLRPLADPRTARGAAWPACRLRLPCRPRRRPRAHHAATRMNATAVIAEDEPLLAQALQAELARAWPDLRIAANVGDGAAAVRAALEHRPDVLFFDIRMPGQGGLEAAAELADEWPADAPFPALVFV